MVHVTTVCAGTGVVRIGAPVAAGRQAKADAPRVVAQHVALDEGVATSAPEVNAVFRKAVFAPEPLDPIVVDNPPSSLMGIHTSRIATVADVRSPRVRQLDARTRNDPVVRIIAIRGWVDLDRLLTGI